VAAALAAVLLLAGCQPGTLLEQDGGPMRRMATWTFTAPGAWDLHWSYSDCPDRLGRDGRSWRDGRPDPRARTGRRVAVIAVMPSLLQYRAGLRSAAGVKQFSQSGPVRLQVSSRCRWQVRAVAV
jgi:hypothetical protein